MSTTTASPADQASPGASHSDRWDWVDLAVLALWVGFIVALNRWGAGLATRTEIGLGEPPLHGSWNIRANAGTVLALFAGLTMAAYGPVLARRLPWRWLVVAVIAAAALWGMALALNDGVEGWTRGMGHNTDYVRVADAVDGPGEFLDDFVEEIRDGSHPTHVAGHPPGFVLFLWSLRVVGLGGTGWATAAVIAGGSAALGVILVTVRAVAGESVARAAAPFLALSPAAVRLVTTADAFFALVGAIGAGALCVAACRSGRRSDALAIVGGIGLGASVLLSYGLALLAVVPLVICWRNRAIRPLLLGGAAAGLVVLAFVPSGFWWLDGLDATRERYWSGYAKTRPYNYFLLANVGAVALTVGPAIAMALRRIGRSPVAPLALGALAAMIIANVSGMSKGEVERIWIPFALWVLPVGAVYATRLRWQQSALVLQVVAAVALQTVIHSS